MVVVVVAVVVVVEKKLIEFDSVFCIKQTQLHEWPLEFFFCGTKFIQINNNRPSSIVDIGITFKFEIQKKT